MAVLGNLERLLDASLFDITESFLLVLRLFVVDKRDIFLELHNSLVLVPFFFLFLFLVFLGFHYLGIHPKLLTPPHMDQYSVQKYFQRVRHLLLNRQLSNIRLQVVLRQGEQLLCCKVFLDVLNKVRQEVDVEVSVGANPRAVGSKQPVR